jgi:hypothetical protein
MRPEQLQPEKGEFWLAHFCLSFSRLRETLCPLEAEVVVD